jgi:hypothetical protein
MIVQLHSFLRFTSIKNVTNSSKTIKNLSLEKEDSPIMLGKKTFTNASLMKVSIIVSHKTCFLQKNQGPSYKMKIRLRTS